MVDRLLFDFDFLLLHSCLIGFVLPERGPVSFDSSTIRVGIAGGVTKAGAEACVGYFAVGYSERPLVEDIDWYFEIFAFVEIFRLALS